MSVSAIVTTLSIDGVPVADTAHALEAGDPTALSGATVDWGRPTVVDQPDPSAAEFTIAQRANDEAAGFLTRLRTGRHVELTATATLFPDPTVSTMPDPGFENTFIGTTPPGRYENAIAAVTQTAAHTGARSLEVRARNARLPVVIDLVPAPFSADPVAWDAIPTTVQGGGWSIAAAVRGPARTHITLAPVYYPSPTGAGAIVGPVLAEGDVDGTWIALDGTAFPPLSGRWVGVRITIDPVGLRWLDVDPSASWDDVDGTWLDQLLCHVDDVEVLAPTGGTERTVLVYSGRITDLAARIRRDMPEAVGPAVEVHVTARDFTADLAQVSIGDDPWPVQAMAARVNRILSLAGTGVTARIDPTVAPTLVTWRDVDAQPAADLIAELASSVDAVAWSAVHQTTGPYYWIEDPDLRIPLLVLRRNPATGLVGLAVGADMPGVTRLRAGLILEEPFTPTQDVSDVATRVDVVWLEQGVDDQGKPETTERHIKLVDPGLEEHYGQRNHYRGTQLQSYADGYAVATRLLKRLDQSGWRIKDLTWDTRHTIWDPDTVAAALDLLDGTHRIGMPILLTDMPSWTPVGPHLGAYVEGGSYACEQGHWRLQTTLSRAGSTGRSLHWEDADPTWAWDDLDPDLAWDDLMAVGPDTTGGTP